MKYFNLSTKINHPRIYIIIFFVLIYFFSGKNKVFAQDDKFRALFIFNFSKNIEWPNTNTSEDFTISVFGSSPVTEELKIIAGQKKVGNQQIIIKKISTVAEIQKINILYVPANKSDGIKEILAACNGKKILLVTEKAGFAKNYSCINFVFDNTGKLSYEINQANIKAQGLKVPQMIVQLGIPIN